MAGDGDERDDDADKGELWDNNDDEGEEQDTDAYNFIIKL